MESSTARLLSLLGISVPLAQAPIGSGSCPELAAAVSNAGALGSLAGTWKTPDELRAQIRATRVLTERPFAVNLVLAFPQEERLAICLEEGVSVISLAWGDPTPFAGRIAGAGATLVHQVGTAADAKAAVDAGAAAIVAQGWEAGGHVHAEVATLPLVPAVVDAVDPVPVLAAGGIADGRGLAAALALGAAGAWIGTRFLAASEAALHPRYKQALVDATEADTTHGVLFDGGWTGTPHRVLRTGPVAAWEAAGRPERPERDEVARLPDGTPVARWSDVIPVAGAEGDLAALAHYAGQGTGLVRRVAPAADIVAELLADARAALGRGTDALG